MGFGAGTASLQSPLHLKRTGACLVTDGGVITSNVGENNQMKAALLTVTLLGLFVLGTHEVQAQAYVPYGAYWDGTQYQQYVQQNDPYYALHVLHYQLYLQPYQPYPVYQPYQPCCFVGGVVVPRSVAVIRSRPRVIFSLPVMRRR